MTTFSFMVMLAAGLLVAGCGQKTAPAPKPTNETSEGSLLTAPVDYLGAVAKAQKHAVKTIDLAGLNQAISMFSAEEGRYPNTLEELVEKQTLHEIPKLPHGLMYDYDPKTGMVKAVPAPATNAPAKPK